MLYNKTAKIVLASLIVVVAAVAIFNVPTTYGPNDPRSDPAYQGNAPVGQGRNADPGPGEFQPNEPSGPSDKTFSHCASDPARLVIGSNTTKENLETQVVVYYHSTDGDVVEGIRFPAKDLAEAIPDDIGTYTIKFGITNVNDIAWAPPIADASIEVAIVPSMDPIPVVYDPHDISDVIGAGNHNGPFVMED